MKKDVRDRWVEALRSGRYRQTTRHLKDETGHCCLGVLCEVIEYPWEDMKRVGGDAYDFNSDQTDPCPITSLALVDLFALAGMNDGANGQNRHSFAEIADYIEKSIPVEAPSESPSAEPVR